MKPKHAINIVTLGCSKNLVDSEVLARQLEANQLHIVHDGADTQAKTVVINTCGFIKDAKQESVDTILQYADAKARGDIQRVFVMGCLSERYKPDLEAEIDHIDGFFGANDLPAIVKAIGAEYKYNLLGERKTSTPSHYAYLKISEGCNRKCSFCAIPLMRGKHKSKTIEEVLTEAKYLTTKGAKELMLIAQDLSYYGFDRYKEYRLAGLLEKLSEIKDMEWIRLHYLYPTQFPYDILPLVAERDNICNYLDMPFQHIANNVLVKMRRGITQKDTYQLIEKIRQTVPDVALRTTLMVGHPGEGDQEFQELIDFVKEVKFERLGVFTYSEEEDTFSARQFKDTVPENIKEERANTLMDIQQEISAELNYNKLGETYKVLVDRREGDYFIGRTEYDSPEVDNEVVIHNSKDLTIGNFYKVKIIDSTEFDLTGEVEE